MNVLIGPSGFGPSHGTLKIHAAPKAVLNHVQWSIADVIGLPVTLDWHRQKISPATFRTELTWSGIIGTGSRLVSTLKGWHYLTFELLEAAGNGSDGSIYMFAPELGLFHGAVGPHGDLMINENQLTRVLAENLKPADMYDAIERLLGKQWDEYLDPFRRSTAEDDNLDARLSV
jgi:hypothetical protein